MFASIAYACRSTLRRPLTRACLLSAACAILLMSLPPLANLSYDLSYLLHRSTTIQDVVLVVADGKTLTELGHDGGLVKRSDHALLLNRLSREKARLVFYDFDFSQTNTPEGDAALASAIATNHTVILVGVWDGEVTPNGLKGEMSPPLPALRTNACGWGHAEFWESIVRSFPPCCSGKPPAAWIAATNLPVALIKGLLGEGAEARRWLHFYGRPGEPTFPSVRFQDAVGTNTALVPAGYFSNKYVFVGQNFPTQRLQAFKDTFQTPYSRFGARDMPGVELQATAFANLVRGDWLRMIPWGYQALLSALWATLLTVLLYQLSRQPLAISLLGGGLAVAVVVVLSLFVQWKTSGHWWWGWFGPTILQSSGVLLWSRLNPRPARYDAFISYRRVPDLGNATSVRLGLRQRGYSVFLDVEERRFGPFPERLRNAIRESEFLLVILSPGSLASRPGIEDWVREEIATAQADAKPIIPLLMPGFDFDKEMASPSLEPRLADLHVKGEEVVRWHPDESLDDFVSKIISIMRAPNSS